MDQPPAGPDGCPYAIRYLDADQRSPDDSWSNAVHDVSFYLHRGETLGLVGESGSGQTRVARIVPGLLASDAGARFAGDPWSDLRERDRRTRRGAPPGSEH